MPKVTLQQAKSHLRIDDDAQDVLITSWIEAAYLAVEGLIFRKVYDSTVPVEDETGVAADELINAAALLIIGWFDVNRDAVTPEVPTAARWLLAGYVNTSGGF